MRPKLNAARAGRAALSTACALFAALALFATTSTRAQQQTATQAESARPAAPAPDAYTGTWEATLPGGPRVATISIVPDGAGGYAGAFVGYEYDRAVDPMPAGTPKVAMRWGSLLKDVRLEAGTMTFKVTLRPPSPPPGMPASIDVNAEVKFAGGDVAELRISHPRKPEPLVLKLTRE